MVNFKEEIAKLIAPQVADLELAEIQSMIEVPQDTKMGDYAFPCFKLAKVLRKAPPLIAKGIAESIQDAPMFEKVEQVNAYVNMFISKAEFVKDVVADVLEKDSAYGKTNIGNGTPVIVEFSSPNIAKPFHIGHIRSTVIGNSIYKLYDAMGYKVTRINHLGDYGTQFGKMIVAYRRWGNEEDVKREPIKTLLHYCTKFHVEAEKDPTLEDEARATFTKLEHGEPEQTASLNGKPLTLSPMEYKMLNLFRKNPRQVLTRGQLLEKLWDIDERFVDEHTLTTSISRIRSKIESDGGAPYIKTVYGMGYQWTGGEAK